MQVFKRRALWSLCPSVLGWVVCIGLSPQAVCDVGGWFLLAGIVL